VIGGGPAGLMAAGRAAQLGCKVTLLEKTDGIGKKLLISGDGRSNITNTCDLPDFVAAFGANGRFLYPAFSTFFRDDLIGFLHRYGVSTSAELDGRIFPESQRSEDVLAALQSYLQEGGVAVSVNSKVIGIEQQEGRVTGVRTRTATEPCTAAILATGGASYPGTGSSGDGYAIAATLGHTIVHPRPSLVALVVKETGIVKSLVGISLTDVRLTSYRCKAEAIPEITLRDYGRGLQGRRLPAPVIESRRGDIVFTPEGLSGPAANLMSLAAGDGIQGGSVSIALDLAPNLSEAKLYSTFQGDLEAHPYQFVSRPLRALMPARVADTIVHMAGIPQDTRAGNLTVTDRRRLVKYIKSLRLNLAGTGPLGTAIVTAGGVSLDEIDHRTMQSRLVKGLFFCGEVLDLDADTGGFNLQAAFSTGFLAGENAATSLLA
jgi:predicted flavoprotein YhiN